MKNKVERVPAIQVTKMGGLKCDNPTCDWEDMSIPVEDYKSYIGVHCPKCGCNILTEADYKSFKLMLRMIKIINFILPRRKPSKEKDALMTMKFNGSGKIDTKIEKEGVNENA